MYSNNLWKIYFKFIVKLCKKEFLFWHEESIFKIQLGEPGKWMQLKNFVYNTVVCTCWILVWKSEWTIYETKVTKMEK